MWFGAVSADCAVFLGSGSAFFALLIWQKACFLEFENMKTVDFLLGDLRKPLLLGGWPRLGRA